MTERPTPLFSPPQHRPPSPLTTIDPGPCVGDTNLHLATATIDHSGRVPAKKHLHTLHWQPGQTTRAHLRGNAIIIQLDPHSPNRIDNRHQIFIPASLRALTNIHTGNKVILLSTPQRAQLVPSSAHGCG